MSVRPRWMTSARFVGVTAGGLVLVLVGIKPIELLGVEALVHAPNAWRSQPPALAGEVRVAVGPPPAELSIAVVDTPNPRGTVFVLHGIRDAKESMSGWAAMLANAGYRAVLVDLRGHGRSTGDTLSYGVRESADLSQVLDALTARKLVVGRVGVMGHSYGAATAIQWAGRDPRVEAVIAVSSFASLRAVVPGYVILPLPSSFVNRVVDQAGERAGFDPDAASPVDAIGRTRAAVLLIHGRADGRIPPWHSERIYAAGLGHAELVLVDGEGHDSVTGSPRTRLAERTAQWFGEHLAAR